MNRVTNLLKIDNHGEQYHLEDTNSNIVFTDEYIKKYDPLNNKNLNSSQRKTVQESIELTSSRKEILKTLITLKHKISLLDKKLYSQYFDDKDTAAYPKNALDVNALKQEEQLTELALRAASVLAKKSVECAVKFLQESELELFIYYCDHTCSYYSIPVNKIIILGEFVDIYKCGIYYGPCENKGCVFCR